VRGPAFGRGPEFYSVVTDAYEAITRGTAYPSSQNAVSDDLILHIADLKKGED